jgi:hypothetical protein
MGAPNAFASELTTTIRGSRRSKYRSVPPPPLPYGLDPSARRPNTPSVVHNQQPVSRGCATGILCKRCLRSPDRTIAIRHDHWTRRPGAAHCPPQRRHVMAPEDTHRHTESCGAIRSPSGDWICRFVNPDGHVRPCQHREQIAEQMQCRCTKRHPFASGERRQFPLHLKSTWNLFESSGFTQRQALPAWQTPRRMLEPQVQRGSKIQHRPSVYRTRCCPAIRFRSRSPGMVASTVSAFVKSMPVTAR